MLRENDILISALVSSYRAERFMRGLLEDLEAQTLRDRMEIVIVDSASPENEGDIVREFQRRFDNIVYLRTEERENAHVSVNRAFRLSRGKYVTPAATDDRHHPRAFERMVAELEAHSEIGLVYADAAVTQTENESWNRCRPVARFLWPEFDPRLLFDVCYVGPHPVYRRTLHEKYGGFDEGMEVAGDYEFWLRLVAAGERFRHVPEVLSLYLQNPRGNEYGNRALCDRESEEARIRHWRSEWGPRPRPGTCFLFPISDPLPPAETTAPTGANPLAASSGSARATGPAATVTTETPAETSPPSLSTGVGTVRTDPGPPAGRTPGVPLVSVITPTKNRPEWLRRAVASALSQTLSDLEVIVVNDGGAPVDALLSEIDPDGRVHTIRLAESRERSCARNAGLALARGKYVAYLDDDDWWEADHLAPLVEELERTGAVGAYSDARTVVEERRGDRYEATAAEDLRLPQFDRSSLLVGNFVPTPCLVHRRDALERSGVFDPSLRTHEDWDLWIRLTGAAPLVHVPRISANISWRTDGSSTTSSMREDFPRTAERIHRRYAAEAASRPGVPEAQVRYVAGLRARLPKTENDASSGPLPKAEDAASSGPRTRAENIASSEPPRGEHGASSGPPRGEHGASSGPLPKDESSASPVPASSPASPAVSAIHGLDACLETAREALRQGDLGAAGYALHELFHEQPDHGEGWLLRGILAIQHLDYDAAADAFETALRLDVDSRRAELGLVMAALGRSRNERAWTLISDLAERHPDDAEVLHWLLRTACVREHFDDAVAPLQRYLDAKPEDAPMHFALAGLFLRLGKLDDAAAQRDRIRSFAPTYDGLSELDAALAAATPGHGATSHRVSPENGSTVG